MTTQGTSSPTGERLVRMETKLDIAIGQQGVALSDHEKRIKVVELQSNTHETVLSDLKQRSLGMFSKAMLIVGAVISALGILKGWLA